MSNSEYTIRVTVGLITTLEDIALTRVNCPRVEARIECPECGYPASESYYYLCPDDGCGWAIAPFGTDNILDPGHQA